MVTKTLYLPRILPMFLEVDHGVFIAVETATSAQWRAAARHLRDAMSELHTIRQIVRLADAIGASESVPLLPLLRSRASTQRAIQIDGDETETSPAG